MFTLELKEKFFRQIQLTENDEILKEVFRILALGSYNKEDHPISSEFKESIDKGLEVYRQGRVDRNKDAKKEFRECLSD